MRALHRPLLALLVPEGLVLLAAVLCLRIVQPSESLELVLGMLPYGVVAAGLLLGWRFQRTRLVFGLIVLSLAWVAVQGTPLWPAGDAPAHDIARQTATLLLPLNLAALALIRERGLFSRAGGARLLSIGAQAVLVLLIAETARDDALRLLTMTPIPDGLIGVPKIGQLAAIGFVAAGGVVLVRALLTRDPLARSLLWSIVACYLAVHASPDARSAGLYLSTAGLMLVVGTVEGAHAMAFRDELTGLPARRALMELLARLDSSYTVAMVDIDHFKQFNDTHGHDVGDQVLRMVAGRLARVRGGGRAFRYGGEEFTIVFPGTSLREALPVLETVREEIEAAPFILRQPGRPRRKPKKSVAGGGRKLTVTVSIGAAQHTPRLAEADAILRAADKALYRAKDEGRNRVAS